MTPITMTINDPNHDPNQKKRKFLFCTNINVNFNRKKQNI